MVVRFAGKHGGEVRSVRPVSGSIGGSLLDGIDEARRMRRLFARVQAWLRTLLDPARLAASPELRFLGPTLWLAGVVGLACGLVGAAFVVVTNLVEQVLIAHLAVGALLGGQLFRFAPEASGE